MSSSAAFMRFRRLLPSLLAALAFAVLLNIPSLVRLASGHPIGLPEMGTSVDEAYYFALIRDAATGHANLGNVSLKEHAGEVGTSSYGPLPQGALMRLTGWSIATVVLAGDLVFPLLACFLLCLAFRPLVRDDRLAALLGFATLAWVVGGGLLRAVSPQATMPILLGYLALFLAPGSGRWGALSRGALIGLLVHLHPVYSLYALLIEGLGIAVRLFRRETTMREEAVTLTLVALPLAASGALKLWLSAGSADAVATIDTYRRMGVIESRLPAAPGLQLTILAVAAAVAWARRRLPGACARLSSLLALLAAGILALNQSPVHGKDIVFGLYYAVPLSIVAWMAALTVLFSFLRSGRTRTVVACMLALVAATAVMRNMLDRVEIYARERAAFEDSGVGTVLQGLATLPPESVVLAPHEVSDLLPVFTDHYVAFGRYARYQRARDEELADRYLLHEAFFPAPEGREDDTYNLVFGLYAGNVAAREHTACRLRSLIGGPAPCPHDIRKHIAHQDVLRRLDERKADVPSLLRRFGVDYVVMPISKEHPLPKEAEALCVQAPAIGSSYALYDCRPGVRQPASG